MDRGPLGQAPSVDQPGGRRGGCPLTTGATSQHAEGRGGHSGTARWFLRPQRPGGAPGRRSLTGSGRPRRTGPRSPLAAEGPFPAAARRGAGAACPPGTLGRGATPERRAWPHARDKGGAPQAQVLFWVLFPAARPAVRLQLTIVQLSTLSPV